MIAQSDLGTLAEVAAALGMRITIEPLPDDEREQVTKPLLDGRSADTGALARHLEELRGTLREAASAAGRGVQASDN